MSVYDWFLEERKRVADGVDSEKFTPVINVDGSLDIIVNARPERYIRMAPMGEGIVFALMRKDSNDWHGKWAYRSEDIDYALEDALRRSMWN